MSLLWVFYQQNVQKLKLSDLPASQPVTIGPDVKDSITIGTIPFESGVISLQRKDSGSQYDVFLGNDCLGSLETDASFSLQTDQQDIRLFLIAGKPEKSVYFTGNRDEMTCSSEKTEADIYLNANDFAFAEQSTFSLLHIGKKWSILPESGNVFLNGEKVISAAPLKPGDEIFWNFTLMRVTEQDLLEIVHYTPLETVLTKTVKPSTEMQK
ncbi:FtsK/SpoIIIE N-terminal domain-containing protein, partial [Bacillus mojavensis]